MTIEELRVKYSELEKSRNELQSKFEEQTLQITNLTKEKSDLQEYNRKLFNDYVLSKEEPPKDNVNDAKTLDDITKQLKSKFEK